MQLYQTYTDSELIALLKQSDEKAFTELYERYWQKLFFVAHKRLRSADDAKEIVQQVFLTLWQKRGSLQILSPEIYLATMVRYAVYRHWSNEKRKPLQLHTVNESEAYSEFDTDSKQFIELLAKFADTLPDKYRLIFISHKILDRPLEEVAEQLGVSPRTAERYVANVMEIMRKHKGEVAFTIVAGIFL